jgi:hypothetical protein
MGNDIAAGHTYSSTSPNNAVTASNLNEHVNGATLKPTAISARTAKATLAGAEEFLINDGGTLKKATANALATFAYPDESVDEDKLSPAAIHAQTEKASPTNSDEILLWDAVDSTLKKTSFGSLAEQPLGGVRGLRIQWASNSTLTISVSAILLLNTTGGGARHISPGSPTVNIETDGVNGLDEGEETPATWYYVWGISNGTNFRGLLSTQATSPAMPTGYTFKMLLGVVRNNGSGHFAPFWQYGNNVFCERIKVLNNVEPGNVNMLEPLGISAAVPPNAISCKAIGYTEDSDPNDWGMMLAGNAAKVGASIFALDAMGGATDWFEGKRIFSFADIPLLTAQTLYWTAKRPDNISNIDITGYTLNL